LDYQNYQIRSFDNEPPHQEEGQLRVQGGESAFDLAHPEAGEEGSVFEEEASQTASSDGLTDFASIKFQRENTLLTNAERYADSIREEAELYVRQLQKEIESLNEQADKRYEEARLAKEESEAEAQRRIDEAERHVEEIRAQGHKEGYEAGHEEGLRKRYEEAGAYLQNLEEILDDLTQFRRHVRYFMEKDGVRLAVLMAKKILQQELKVNKTVIWKLLAATLADMEGTGQFRIWLSPEDFKFAMGARPTLERFINEDQALTFRERAELPPGNAMIETDREVIDLSLVSQFRHMEQALYKSLAESETRAMKLPPEVQRAVEPDPEPVMDSAPAESVEDAPAPPAPEMDLRQSVQAADAAPGEPVVDAVEADTQAPPAGEPDPAGAMPEGAPNE
jgi:flagellar assembly protein FliH